MLLQSTRGESALAGFRDALLQGIAPDGGLYLPVDWPRMDRCDLDAWTDLSLPELAVALAKRLLVAEFQEHVIEGLAADAFNFAVPTIPLEPPHHVLELFHGPTFAFKDVGARFLARFLAQTLREQGRRATVLVATSGDTGGAVAHGFHQVPGINVVVLYPAGKVSPFQEAQMATLGGNVAALRVPGIFDDCQRLVKSAFLDPRLARSGFTSANSINIGRLLPQTFYYVASYLSVVRTIGQPVTFSIPCGNLGNLTAAVMAERLGVPVRRFIAATNANDGFHEFLTGGDWRPRPSLRTISSAMDVGDPSNLPRLLALHDGSREALAGRVWSLRVDDENTMCCIRRVHESTGYLLDPHGAVAFVAARRFADLTHSADPIVTLATAHPAKFGDVIHQAVGFRPALPDAERDWASRPLMAEDLPGTDYEQFASWLHDSGHAHG